MPANLLTLSTRLSIRTSPPVAVVKGESAVFRRILVVEQYWDHAAVSSILYASMPVQSCGRWDAAAQH